MADARINTDMKQGRDGESLLNPMDSLVDDARLIAKFFETVSGEDFINIVLASCGEYTRPWKRRLSNRCAEIDAILKENGYDPKSEMPCAKLKPVKDVFYALTEKGGYNDDSFIPTLVRNVVNAIVEFKLNPSVKLSGDLCKRLKKLTNKQTRLRSQFKRQINEQEWQLAQVKEARLKEEENLIKTKFESTKCKKELLDLELKASSATAKLDEVQEEEREHHQLLTAYQQKLKSIAQKEQEGQERLKMMEDEENKKKSEIELIRRQYASIHIDFDFKDLTTEQLERANTSAKQAFFTHVAYEKGMVKKDEELIQVSKNSRAKKVHKQIREGKIDNENDEGIDIKEMKRLREAEMEEMVKKRKEEMTPNAIKTLRERLERCLRMSQSKVETLDLSLQLEQNKAKQKQVEADKREISLERNGSYATVHEEASIVPQEDYLMDKKPARKSFKEMTIKHSMHSDNPGIMAAYKNLGLFFGEKNQTIQSKLDDIHFPSLS